MIGDETIMLAIDHAGWPVLLADGSGSPAPVTGVVSAVRSSDARRDLVRELAREFDDLSIQDLRERTDVQASNELAQLQAEVRAQVLDDLLDVLDQRVRGRLRKRRTVRLQAPRGYVRRVLAGISAIESEGLAGRLRDRGWSSDDIARTLPHQRSSMSLLG